MSASTPDPTGRPLAEGPHDPEHDPTASYALEPEYVEALTRRILATSGETAEVRSPINGAPLAHTPAWSTAPRSCCACTTWCSTARTRSST